jgi:ADP-ribosylglycohydrolase
MIGTILGDIIGIPYEKHPIKTPDFSPLFGSYCRFSDDTVLTLAVANAILISQSGNLPYHDQILSFARKYPRAGYGKKFIGWMYAENPQPYYSFGNGSAMRVAPIAWAFHSIEDVLQEAEKSAVITHNHPLGIQGAQATALAIFLARNGKSKEEIKYEIQSRFQYDLNRTLDEIRPNYEFDVTCQGSVPEAIIAFLESSDVESAIRLAISLGGDADTQAAIAGSIAEAFYQHDEASMQTLLILVKTLKSHAYLKSDLLNILIAFYEKYIPNSPIIKVLKDE